MVTECEIKNPIAVFRNEETKTGSEDTLQFGCEGPVGEKLVAGQEIMIKGWVVFLAFLTGRIGKCLNARYQKSAERKRIKYRDCTVKFVSDVFWAGGPPVLYEPGR